MQLNLPLRGTIGISVYGAGLPGNSDAQGKGESVQGECFLGVQSGREAFIYRKPQQIKFLTVREHLLWMLDKTAICFLHRRASLLSPFFALFCTFFPFFSSISQTVFPVKLTMCRTCFVLYESYYNLRVTALFPILQKRNLRFKQLQVHPKNTELGFEGRISNLQSWTRSVRASSYFDLPDYPESSQGQAEKPLNWWTWVLLGSSPPFT